MHRNESDATDHILSFDHRVGPRDQLRRHFEAQRLGGFEIDSQIEFGRLLYWQLARFGALENSIDISRGAAIQVCVARTVTQQASSLYEFWKKYIAGSRFLAARSTIRSL